jgi:hypothetical protein
MTTNDDRVAYLFGHLYFVDRAAKCLRYCDNREEVPPGPSKRPCPKCDRLPTPAGHDPCVASLPGVIAACCGHGVEDGYIMFADNRTIRFRLLSDGARPHRPRHGPPRG